MILMAPCARAIGQRLFCALAAMKAREPHSLHIAFTVWPMDINDVNHIVRGQKRPIMVSLRPPRRNRCTTVLKQCTM